VPATSRTLYFVLIGWCLVGSSLRVLWFIRHGIAIDALPVITILIAVAAIVHAFRPHRVRRRTEQ
jgi:hypothetical protein